ncbi:MAG: GNAT family N-acetyltransferase [Anaerolineae bacterium]|nr:GNAT family N-acetyltransferase [Anaerolineae bacterium]
MDEQYEIVYTDEPAWDVIGPAINEYNDQQAGPQKGKMLCFVIRDPDQAVVGGVIAEMYWEWLCVHLIWIREDLRHQGYGQRLMASIEDEGRKRGAKYVHLDTFTFQAPDFYRKLGYQVFGELKDCPAGHTRYYFTKPL